jgi:hypothetical protein
LPILSRIQGGIDFAVFVILGADEGVLARDRRRGEKMTILGLESGSLLETKFEVGVPDVGEMAFELEPFASGRDFISRAFALNPDQAF